MGFTQVHRDRLAPNPYVVYFSDTPFRNSLRGAIIESGSWFGEAQTRAIREYMNIPKVFGDPVMALVMCAVGYERHYNVDASVVSGRDDEGEHVRLSGLLGDAEKKHVWRCRESVYRLRDSVEWACLCDGQTPGAFWVDDDEETLLCWAAAHGIPLTESGAARYAEYSRSYDLVRQSVFPSSLLRLNPDWRLIDIPSSIEECRHPLKSDYEQDWTEALRERLKEALAQVGLQVDAGQGDAGAASIASSLPSIATVPAPAVEEPAPAKPPVGHLAADVKEPPRIRLDPSPRKWGDILIYADDQREDGVRVRTGTARQGVFVSAEQLGLQTKGGKMIKAWKTFHDALDSPKSSGGMFRASISYSDSPKTKRECVRRQISDLNRLLMAAFGIESRPFNPTVGKGNLHEGLWLSEFQVRG